MKKKFVDKMETKNARLLKTYDAMKVATMPVLFTYSSRTGLIKQIELFT